MTEFWKSIIQNTIFAILAFAMGWLFRDSIIPFIKEFGYVGNNLEGTWVMPKNNQILCQDDTLSFSYVYSMEIVQSGDELTGNVVVQVEKGMVNYEVVGRIKNSTVQMTWFNLNRNSSSISTFLLEIDQSSRTTILSGKRIFFGVKLKRFFCQEVYFEKQSG